MKPQSDLRHHLYRFGIEEEYFLIDSETGEINTGYAAEFTRLAQFGLGRRVMTELLQSQIEVATEPLSSPDAARNALLSFRRRLADIGELFGVGLVAAGTHPLAFPDQQRITPSPRYQAMVHDLGIVGVGNPICGLHVHVEVARPEERVQIMQRLIPFLPILLALSTSSPFWAGRDTGLLGYRCACNDQLPRTGFPEMFQTMDEYRAYVETLIRTGIIPDQTYVWWPLRPSLQHPTLELRITDACTSVDDAIAIASLYRAMVRFATRTQSSGGEFCPVARALTEENRWRAQRYGTDGSYIDVQTLELKPFKQLLGDTISLLEHDIDALDLAQEVGRARLIPDRGTSAHLQIRSYAELLNSHPQRDALLKVSKWLAQCTKTGAFMNLQNKADHAAPARRNVAMGPALVH